MTRRSKAQIKRALKEPCDSGADQVIVRTNGEVVFRRYYFFRHGLTSARFRQRMVRFAENLCLTVLDETDRDHYDRWPNVSYFEATLKIAELKPTTKRGRKA